MPQRMQKASAAIAALYSGVLAVVFSVTSNPLPARGALAPLFLGLAVVLSTAYVAYLGPAKGFTPGPKPLLALEPKSFQRLNAFIEVTNRIATRRSGCLRASVVSLGVGLIFIAAPFISFSHVANTAQTVANAPAWPTPPPGTTSELDKIVFQARVNEVAAARQKANQGGDQTQDDAMLIVGLLLGVIAVVAVPLMIRQD